jgi:hypothetical protein
VSSPLEPSGASALITVSPASMPSVARFRRRGDDPGWFVLADPAGRHSAIGRPDRTVDFEPAIRTIIFLVSIVGFGLWAARGESSTPEALLYFLLGGSVGALAAGVVTAVTSGLPHTWHRSGDKGLRLRVRPTEERAWRLCEIVAALAETQSWTDRTIDPQRRAPAILWSAVGRSLEVERQYLDAQRALGHPSLQALGQESLARVERERESLDAVEANLRTVLSTALDVDQQRARLAQERRRWAEERELRGRMAGSHGSPIGPAESDRQADLSAGLAAETATIAELLAASDALLLELE